ncbi:hypothetical protein F4804DRAFT_35164 [Jackrogersella minutella]|nr:hypothetical protein F4804DRAFT_35164 [Jackrogersella minutella]
MWMRHITSRKYRGKFIRARLSVGASERPSLGARLRQYTARGLGTSLQSARTGIQTTTEGPKCLASSPHALEKLVVTLTSPPRSFPSAPTSSL